MDIFAAENVGRHIRCRLEKDGDLATDVVRWTHAMVGQVVDRKVLISKPSRSGRSLNLVTEISKDWKVIEVGV